MGFKKIAGELFPWEEEEKGKEPKRLDSIPPKTSIRSRVHSKPKIKGQELLDLYLMLKQKDRAEKFGETIGKIQKQTADDWRKMKKEIRDAEGNLPLSGKDDVEIKTEKEKQSKKRTPKKPMKTIVIDY